MKVHFLYVIKKMNISCSAAVQANQMLI